MDISFCHNPPFLRADYLTIGGYSIWMLSLSNLRRKLHLIILNLYNRDEEVGFVLKRHKLRMIGQLKRMEADGIKNG